ncbi:MAG: Gldg family protein [Elusimicrobiota bacterium]
MAGIILKFNDKSKDKIISGIGIVGVILLISGSFLYIINPVITVWLVLLLISGIAGMGWYIVVNKKMVINLLQRKSTVQGANFAILTLCVLGIFIFVQALAVRHHLQMDFTKSKRFSLSPQARKVFAGLDKEVHAFAFFKPSQPDRVQSEDLLKQFTAYSRLFKYELIDPDRKPALAKRYGIENYGTIVMESGGQVQKVEGVTEEKFVNALTKLFRMEKKTVYFTVGHREKQLENQEAVGYSVVKKEVESQGYVVNTIELIRATSVPSDCSALIIPGPLNDLLTNEINVLKKYLMMDGRVLLMIDPEVRTPNLKKFIGTLGLKLSEDIIIDKVSQVFGGDFFVPVAMDYSDHQITKDMKRVTTFFPYARTVKLAENLPVGISTKWLVRTGQQSWAEVDLDSMRTKKMATFNAGTDIVGPLNIAMSADITNLDNRATAAKLVVYGDSDFVMNSNFGLSGNRDLFLNTVAWLVEEGNLISIRPKEKDVQPLFLTAGQGRVIFLLIVLIIPLTVLGAGIYMLIRRRAV